MLPTGHRDDQDRAAEVIGTPPHTVRPAFTLEPEAVRLMLTAPAAAATMDLLGISEPDRSELLALIPRAVADDEILAAITQVANLLRAEAGLTAAPAELGARKEADDALQARLVPGQGLVAILGHLVGTDTVRAWHAARGLSSEQSWGVLADLGQQMRVHRATFGELGHHTLAWTAMNWAGRLFWLGRLQFDLHRRRDGDGERWALGVHIPATGPLSPAAVEASLDAATAFFTARFADLGAGRPPAAPPFGREFECTSWLVSAELPRLLGPDSNLGAFARRWQIEDTYDAAGDAAFFVFHRRPPVVPEQLVARTRLERAVQERLVAGEGWRGGIGRLVR